VFVLFKHEKRLFSPFLSTGLSERFTDNRFAVKKSTQLHKFTNHE